MWFGSSVCVRVLYVFREGLCGWCGVFVCLNTGGGLVRFLVLFGFKLKCSLAVNQSLDSWSTSGLVRQTCPDTCQTRSPGAMGEKERDNKRYPCPPRRCGRQIVHLLMKSYERQSWCSTALLEEIRLSQLASLTKFSFPVYMCRKPTALSTPSLVMQLIRRFMTGFKILNAFGLISNSACLVNAQKNQPNTQHHRIELHSLVIAHKCSYLGG